MRVRDESPALLHQKKKLLGGERFAIRDILRDAKKAAALRPAAFSR